MRTVIASISTGLVAAVIAVVVVLALSGDDAGPNPSDAVDLSAAVRQAEAPAVLADAADPGRQAVASTVGETTIVEEPEGGVAQLVAPLGDFNPAQIFVDVSPSVVSIEAGQAGGSGFFVDSRGRVVTNYHVVQSGAALVVVDVDGRRSPAELLGFDAANDLAVLQVDPSLVTVRPVPLADSDAVVVGEPVAAIGNPFGLQTSLTTGIVSAIERTRPGLSVNGRPQRGLIQTDASINPGNSGGVLLNAAGEVLGVTASVESPIRGSVGVGFAIPSSTVAGSLPRMIAGETIEHPWMGISVAGGAGDASTVGSVVAGGPAAQAGLRAGDTLRSADGLALESFEALADVLFDLKVGDVVRFEVERGGETITIDVTLGAWPD
jgi:putative serine protease PepD